MEKNEWMGLKSMFTERQGLQDELHYNRREIQSLRERNQEILKRLGELDDRDLNDDISYDALASLTESLKECIDKLSSLVPSVSALDVIKHIAEDVNPEQVLVTAASKEDHSEDKSSFNQKVQSSEGPRIVEKEKPETEARIKEAIREQKIRMPNNPKMSTERAASVIKEILEERGTAKVKDIEKKFTRRTGSKYANFYEKMQRASEIYPNIQKISMGKWCIRRPGLTAVNN